MGEDDGTYYQIVCTCGPVPWIQATTWLAKQIGHKFEDGTVIENIDAFQFITCKSEPQYVGTPYRVVALCSVYKPAQD